MGTLFSNDMSRAVDRYADARFNPVSPPTREEVELLRAEVLRTTLLNLVNVMLRDVGDRKKDLNMEERNLGRLKSALELVNPMVEVVDGEADGRPEGGAAAR